MLFTFQRSGWKNGGMREKKEFEEDLNSSRSVYYDIFTFQRSV